MKNILLLYPDMLFYKVPIFNKLGIYLEERGYKLIIWYRHISDPNNERSFNFIDKVPMTLSNYSKVLEREHIDAVINILFKSDPGYMFYTASIMKTRAMKIPIIFYGHCIDKQKDQLWRNIAYNLTYFTFDGIILYTPAEKAKLWKRFHHKVTCANNTLDMDNMDIRETKDQIKERYNISSTRIILTTGRLQGRKRIEILSEIFIKDYKNSPDVGWVIVGPDLSDEIKNSINGISNIYYLGPVYDKLKMAEIFSMADLYCVPGALGLGIIEALFWGLPVLTMDVNHGPEAYYLRNGSNSLIGKNEQELRQNIRNLLSDDNTRNAFSLHARKVFQEEATLDKMFDGFSLQLNRFFNESTGTKHKKEFANS
jgi:glycosyltransferase involved in cell wall biosynthesis